MGESIQRGANVVISPTNAPIGPIQVKIGWKAPQGFDLDASVFLLNNSGRVRSDEDFIFYNQKTDQAGSVIHTAWDNGQGFQILLAKVPGEISRLAFCLTIDRAAERRQCFEQVSGVYITIRDLRSSLKIASYQLWDDVKAETAIILGELYRHSTGWKSQAVWKFRAVGQGYAGGLAALAIGFGVEIEQDVPTVQPPSLSIPKHILDLSSRTQPPSQSSTATHCVKCGKKFGFLFSGNPHTSRCKACDGLVWNTLGQFRRLFLRCCEDGILTYTEWVELFEYTKQHGLNWNEALSYVRGDAVYFLERQLAIAWDDGIITDDEFTYIHELQKGLGIPFSQAQPIFKRLNYLKQVSEIRKGILPSIATSTHLESGELCHLEAHANYHKVLSQKIELINGRLMASTKKLHFLSVSGGWTIAWKNIMRIESYPRSVYIELNTKKGNGRYDVTDPMLVEAVLSSLTKINKRALLIPHDDTATRHIPQPVKIAVWQRDQGKCAQCGATSYLEFDHIIPHSKGGASTANNVQLLCRRCNLSKGDRL